MAGSGAGCNRLKNNRFKAVQDFEENIKVKDTIFLKEGVAGLEASIQIEQDGGVNIDSPVGLKVNDTILLDEDAITELRSGMSEAEFRALQKERKANRVGSGFDAFYHSLYTSQYDIINEGGFYTKKHSYITTTDSGRLYLVLDGGGFNVNVNGIKCFIKNVVGGSSRVELPGAPADENARQDFVGIEVWEELVSDTDFIFPNGAVQSSASTMNDIATVTASFTGADTYSLYGNWQSSGDLTGKGLVWSKLSHADRLTVLNDPDNNLFWNEDGVLVQVRYRIRVVQGLTTNGAEWENNGQNFTATLKYDASNYVTPKGKQTSITNDLRVASIDDYTGVTGEKLGHFVTETVNTSLAYKGNCYFLPISMVPRNRNTGAFHPEFNKNGSKKFSDGFWYETALSITSIADCLNASNLLTASGNIASGISGRPDGLYYDEINERDVRDLRLPTFYEEVTTARCNTELNKAFSNQNRGYEAEFEITHVNPVSATLDSKAYTNNNYGTTTTTLSFYADGIFSSPLTVGSSSVLDKDIIAFIKGESGQYYYGTYARFDGTNSFVYLHPRHGDVTTDFTAGNQYSVIVAQRTDSFSNNKISRCEIIGKPELADFITVTGDNKTADIQIGTYVKADGSYYKSKVARGSITIDPDTEDYSNTTNWEDLGITVCNYQQRIHAGHVGVPNLINVNDLSSNLPADVSYSGAYPNCKAFLLQKKIEEVLSIHSVMVDGVEFINTPFSSINSTSLGYNFNSSINYLYINFKSSYSALGYNDEADMADNCVIEVYYEGYAEEFDSSVSEEVESSCNSSVYAINGSDKNYGALILNELAGRIGFITSFPFMGSAEIVKKYIAPHIRKFFGDSNFPILHENIALNINGEKGVKAFLYVTNKDGLLYPCLAFKEMIYDVDWGDNSKFEITDYIKTTTDDNTKVITYGTVVAKNPIGFAKGQ